MNTDGHRWTQMEAVGKGHCSDAMTSPFGGPSPAGLSFQLSVFMCVHLWLPLASDCIVSAKSWFGCSLSGVHNWRRPELTGGRPCIWRPPVEVRGR